VRSAGQAATALGVVPFGGQVGRDAAGGLVPALAGQLGVEPGQRPHDLTGEERRATAGDGLVVRKVPAGDDRALVGDGSGQEAPERAQHVVAVLVAGGPPPLDEGVDQ